MTTCRIAHQISDFDDRLKEVFVIELMYSLSIAKRYLSCA